MDRPRGVATTNPARAVLQCLPIADFRGGFPFPVIPHGVVCMEYPCFNSFTFSPMLSNLDHPMFPKVSILELRVPLFLKTHFIRSLWASLLICGCAGPGRKPEVCNDRGLLAVVNHDVHFNNAQNVRVKYAFHKTEHYRRISHSDLIAAPSEEIGTLLSFAQSPWTLGPGCDCGPDLTFVFDEPGHNAFVIFAWIDSRKIVYGELAYASVGTSGDYFIDGKPSQCFSVFDPERSLFLHFDALSSVALYKWSSKLVHEKNTAFLNQVMKADE